MKSIRKKMPAWIYVVAFVLATGFYDQPGRSQTKSNNNQRNAQASEDGQSSTQVWTIVDLTDEANEGCDLVKLREAVKQCGFSIELTFCQYARPEVTADREHKKELEELLHGVGVRNFPPLGPPPTKDITSNPRVECDPRIKSKHGSASASGGENANVSNSGRGGFSDEMLAITRNQLTEQEANQNKEAIKTALKRNLLGEIEVRTDKIKIVESKRTTTYYFVVLRSPALDYRIGSAVYRLARSVQPHKHGVIRYEWE